MGLGYPPPSPSRQKPLGADLGGSRSIGAPACLEPGSLRSTCTDACGQGRARVVAGLAPVAAQSRNGRPVSFPALSDRSDPESPRCLTTCGLSPFCCRHAASGLVYPRVTRGGIQPFVGSALPAEAGPCYRTGVPSQR